MDDLDVGFGIIGTNLTAAILACKLSEHINVLHLDNECYGNKCATLDSKDFSKDHSSFPHELADCKIELWPKLVHSNSELVKLMIESKVGTYLDFKAISDIWFWTSEKIRVPCSKEDVLLDDSISLIEKRQIMKVLNEAKNSETEDRNSFAEYLHDKLPLRFVKLVLFAICQCKSIKESQEISISEGFNRIKYFLSGIGVYGKTPYIFPIHGSSEIIQAFCRLAAVRNSVYILGTPITVHEKTITTEYGTITLDNVQQASFKKCGKSRKVSRTIALIKSESLDNELHIYESAFTVFAVLLGHEISLCPEGFQILFAWSEYSSESEKDHKQFVGKFVDVVAVYHYTDFVYDDCVCGTCIPDPSLSVDYGDSVSIATEIFQSISKSIFRSTQA